MSKTAKILTLVLAFCLVLTAVGCKENGAGGNPFNPPKDLMTTEEYHAELEKLLAKEDMSQVDDAFLAELDKLGDRLEDQIRYNTEDITECSGTKYYVSSINGNDENDGKSPETAFATLDKINKITVKEGDLVLFERGSFFRGFISAKSGVSYSAYGKGHKPIISSSVDGTEGEWEETETENVWVYSEKVNAADVGSVVFDFGLETECYADKADSIKKLKKEYQFVHAGGKSEQRPVNNKIYLYSKGNPAEKFETIEISTSSDNISMSTYAKDITVNNIEFRYGNNPYFKTGVSNITMSYCISSFAGGTYDNGGTRLGGGAGAWLECDNLVYDHCYFYEQFDSGVTPQHVGSLEGDKKPSIFANFITKDCLFEKCEYTLEYFQSQTGTDEDCFKNMYFGYNFCRLGGYGFGDKPSASAYIKSWGHENNCYDCVIEYNVFDRAAATSIEVMNKKKDDSLLPTLRKNIYIQQEGKKFATLHSGTYKYTKEDIAKVNALDFDNDSVHFFAPAEEK